MFALKTVPAGFSVAERPAPLVTDDQSGARLTAYVTDLFLCVLSGLILFHVLVPPFLHIDHAIVQHGEGESLWMAFEHYSHPGGH